LLCHAVSIFVICREQLIKQTAKVMATDGYLNAGYQYIIIDDCWPAKDRAADGQLVPEPSQFPSGMKSLADYVSQFKSL
jgi:hypothetical protein